MCRSVIVCAMFQPAAIDLPHHAVEQDPEVSNRIRLWNRAGDVGRPLPRDARMVASGVFPPHALSSGMPASGRERSSAR
jgi:hypothetical protein